MGYIYISHSSSDDQLAAHVADFLERRGIACWYSPRNAGSSQNPARAISEAINNSSATLLLFSSTAEDSQNVRKDVDLTDKSGSSLLALRVEDVQPDRFSYLLDHCQWIDWINRADGVLEQVWEALKDKTERSNARARVASTTRAQRVPAPPTRPVEVPPAQPVAPGQKVWLKPSSREFVRAPAVPREKRVLSSNTENPNAVGYLRMRAVSNGSYDTYHEVKRANGSIYGYFTDGFSQVAYTYGFVSPDNDDKLLILNNNFRSDKSTLSIVEPHGTALLKMAPKFAVTQRHVLNFQISDGEIMEFNFRDPYQNKLFCLNASGFFMFDHVDGRFSANVAFEVPYLGHRQIAVSPIAPLLAVSMCKYDRRRVTDNQDIWKPVIQIFQIETGEQLMEFDLQGTDNVDWQIDFSRDGQMLRAQKGQTIHTYELIEVG